MAVTGEPKKRGRPCCPKPLKGLGSANYCSLKEGREKKQMLKKRQKSLEKGRVRAGLKFVALKKEIYNLSQQKVQRRKKREKNVEDGNVGVKFGVEANRIRTQTGPFPALKKMSRNNPPIL